MVDYDPFAEWVRSDPQPVYKRLRDEAPAYYMSKYDAWALSRFQDIWDASSDPDAYSAAKGTPNSSPATRPSCRCSTLEGILSRMPDYEVDEGGAVLLRTEFVQGFASLPIRC